MQALPCFFFPAPSLVPRAREWTRLSGEASSGQGWYMTRDLNVMKTIQKQKDKDIKKATIQPLNPEGIVMSKHKRDTLDVVDTPVDPLR